MSKNVEELSERLNKALGKIAYTPAIELRAIFDELVTELSENPPVADETPFSIIRKLDEIKNEVLFHQQQITIYPNELDIVIVPKVVDGKYVLNLFHKADTRVMAIVEESLSLMIPSPIFTEGTSEVNINLGVKR